MQNLKEVNKRVSLDRVSLSNTPKLIISQKLKNQIDYLHEMVGTAEWSGELMTSEIGVITDLDNWTIVAEELYLADIGVGTFTGYEVDKGGFKAVDIIQMYEAFPDLMGLNENHRLKNHHIHTHHSMGAFFSGTDWENLEDRALVSNYFMMLIVDFKGNYKAKVAYKAKVKTNGKETLEFSNNQDGFKNIVLNGGRVEKEVLVVMDCKIEMPEEGSSNDYKKAKKYREVADILREIGDESDYLNYLVKASEISSIDTPFMDRYNYVKTAVEVEKKESEKNRFDYVSRYKDKETVQAKLPFQYEKTWDSFDSYRDSFDYYTPKREKKISEMTQGEFNEWYSEEENRQTKKSNDAKKFTDKDICTTINAALNDTTYPLDFTNPMYRIVEDNKSHKSEGDKAKYASDLMFNIQFAFDTLYPTATEQDYSAFLEGVYNKFDKYKNSPLVKAVMDEIIEERIEIEESN